MRKIIYIGTLLILAISCTSEKPNNFATVEGKIISGDIEQVVFQWIKENPIDDKGNLYTAKVDSLYNFKIDIPVERFATGQILSGGFYHDICLMPGDQFKIIIDGDSINYNGKGSAKNNFLYALERNGLSAQRVNRQSFEDDFSPTEYLTFVKEFKAKCFAFLKLFPDKGELEERFIEYYKIDNQVLCESLIQNYPRLYGYKNRINPDTIQFPVEYEKMYELSELMDDNKIVSSNYLFNIQTALNKIASLNNADPALTRNEAMYTLIFDSLNGKTKEYTLAKYIIGKLSYSDTYDSIAIKYYVDMNHDLISGKVVKSAMVKFSEKHALIGQALNDEFAQTKLLDTANVELTFAEMMNKYKGNVVYLDMWSLGCGPCRVAMPHSKKLKEKLADQSVKFVYITVDRYTDKLCKNLFDVSLTKENHYIFKNGFNSKLHDFMGINWVPNYMIFDKKGQLVDYNASRPTADDNGVSPLEKELRELASK